jgi:hypothetical protein
MCSFRVPRVRFPPTEINRTRRARRSDVLYTRLGPILPRACTGSPRGRTGRRVERRFLPGRLRCRRRLPSFRLHRPRRRLRLPRQHRLPPRQRRLPPRRLTRPSGPLQLPRKLARTCSARRHNPSQQRTRRRPSRHRKRARRRSRPAQTLTCRARTRPRSRTQRSRGSGQITATMRNRRRPRRPLPHLRRRRRPRTHIRRTEKPSSTLRLLPRTDPRLTAGTDCRRGNFLVPS